MFFNGGSVFLCFSDHQYFRISLNAVIYRNIAHRSLSFLWDLSGPIGRCYRIPWCFLKSRLRRFGSHTSKVLLWFLFVPGIFPICFLYFVQKLQDQQQNNRQVIKTRMMGARKTKRTVLQIRFQLQ